MSARKITLSLEEVPDPPGEGQAHGDRLDLTAADLAILEHQLWEAESRLRALLNIGHRPGAAGAQEAQRHWKTVRRIREFVSGFLESGE